ncbi:MAG: glycosyltransferase family 2 protein [Hylemonella sp.]
MNIFPSTSSVPQISVVVPVHNGARWLGETLDALYAQSFSDFEVLLVDDASTDELSDVLDQHADVRLRVVHLDKNVGVSAARNHGIELARGSYIAFCDADDLPCPQRLELQWRFLEKNPKIGMCGSAFTCFDTQDRETVSPPETDAQIRKALMAGNCFGLSTVMIRASILKEHRFDSSMQLAEDYELWTRLVTSGVRVVNLSESLVRYRLHPQQASRNKGAQLDQVSRQVRALYCARLIGDEGWVKKLRNEPVGLSDLISAGCRVIDFIARHPDFAARDFRFMLAWLYQRLPDHGVRSWWRWVRMQNHLRLHLDLNYKFNTALLALLPVELRHKYFDVLIKLKR